MSNGMGAIPLTWQEIESWQNGTRRQLEWWIPQLIREMSEAYVLELNQATDAARPAPFVDTEYVDRQVVNDKLKSMFRGFMSAKPSKK